MRPTDLFPSPMLDELLRLALSDREWVKCKFLDEQQFKIYCEFKTPLMLSWSKGSDGLSMLAISLWLADGPKVFCPTLEQCQALEQVDVNLPFEEYTQPYPTLLVELPKGQYDPFLAVLCHHSERILSCSLVSKNNTNDIVTIMSNRQKTIEHALNKFDDDCKDTAFLASRALRVACNSCLALSHYGCHYDYLFPKEVANDKHLAKEKSERGERARSRIPLAVLRVEFNQTVQLRRTEDKFKGNENPSGKEVSCHWRRGHWHSVLHGVGKTQRKKMFYPPVLVRADLLEGDTSKSRTIYKG